MTFGQPSGPPATARQVRHLSTLVVAAGHTDFRDARGPLGLTQRQAAGRFTRDEAEALITRLEAEAGTDGAPDTGMLPVTASRTAKSVPVLQDVSSEVLAAELQQRGWVVMEP